MSQVGGSPIACGVQQLWGIASGPGNGRESLSVQESYGSDWIRLICLEREVKTQIPGRSHPSMGQFWGQTVNLPKAKGSEKFPAPGPSLRLLCFKICKLLRLVQRFGDQSQGVWDLMDTHGMSNKTHGKMVWYSLPTWTNYSYKWSDSLKTTFGRVLIIPDWKCFNLSVFFP